MDEGAFGIQSYYIDNETRTLIDQPEYSIWTMEKYSQKIYIDRISPITYGYEIITTFMKIHNITATWVSGDFGDSSYQLATGGWWCEEGAILECCPPM